ncbi:hemolysin family protein [Haploplasma modicum]|uniref:hemolysin family protein n=1 Tax=Haploplasma modicum TaxID=2150 RepID=UPI00214C4FD7|nr:hemolysin family protein [Haploplasma modicum]MCR1808829.1 hemolysin family protein [Haploplasma modicum]
MEIFYLIVILFFINVYNSLIMSNVELTDKEDDVKIDKHSKISNYFVLLTLIMILGIKVYLLLGRVNLKPIIKFPLSIYLSGFLILVFGVIPFYRVTKKYPEVMIKIFGIFEKLTKYLFYPLSALYLFLKSIIYKEEKEIMTEDEFLEFIDQAEQQSGITEDESKLIKSVLDFNDLKIEDIYTPRTELVSINIKDEIKDITNSFVKSGFSRLPVYEETIDNIIGTINYKDFYNNVLIKNKKLKSVIQAPLEVTEYMDVKNLLSLLKLNKQHLAIVKDEFGGTLGIVTMEDVLEELVGDIYDEHDKVDFNVKELAPSKYVVSGQTYIDELEGIINTQALDKEDYLTVNGWVIANLGKIGQKNDSFIYDGFMVTVLKADNKKVIEVELEKIDHLQRED